MPAWLTQGHRRHRSQFLNGIFVDHCRWSHLRDDLVFCRPRTAEGFERVVLLFPNAAAPGPLGLAIRRFGALNEHAE